MQWFSDGGVFPHLLKLLDEEGAGEPAATLRVKVGWSHAALPCTKRIPTAREQVRKECQGPHGHAGLNACCNNTRMANPQ